MSQNISTLEKASLIIRNLFNPKIKNFQRLKDKKPEIVITADIDHTLIPWSDDKYRTEVNKKFLQGNQDAFQSVADKSIFITATGMDFNSVSEMHNYLNGFPPMDFLFTDNSKILHINENGEIQSKWLKENLKSDDDFEVFMNSVIGWDNNLFYNILQETFNEIGFQSSNNGKIPKFAYPHQNILQGNIKAPITIVFAKGGSDFYIAESGDNSHDDYKSAAEIIANKVIEKYEKKKTNVKVEYEISDHGDHLYVFFSPIYLKVNKSSSFEVALKYLPQDKITNLKAAIALGDSANDKHLELENIITQEGKEIPVYSILLDKDRLKDLAIKDHKRLFIAKEKGNIGQCFLDVVSKVII